MAQNNGRDNDIRSVLWTAEACQVVECSMFN